MGKHTNVDMLIVEDDPRDVEFTLRALWQPESGTNFHVVHDGAEALDFLFARGAYSNRVALEQPRLVLLDLKLPKVDGHEVLRQLRADERTRTMPVIVMSSSGEERDIRRSYALRADSYIVKPLDCTTFRKAVSRLDIP